MTVDMITIVGNFMECDPQVLRDAQTSIRAVSRALRALENQLNHVDISMNAPFKSSHPNIGVQVSIIPGFIPSSYWSLLCIYKSQY